LVAAGGGNSGALSNVGKERAKRLFSGAGTLNLAHAPDCSPDQSLAAGSRSAVVHGGPTFSAALVDQFRL